MNTGYKAAYLIFLLGISLILGACGKSSSGGGGSPGPVALTASFMRTGPIGNSDDIVVIFSKSMDDTTLVYSGTLKSDAHTLSWNADFNQLTISPTGTWTTGLERSLALTASDAVGNPLPALLRGRFDVVTGGFYYANIARADDTGDGLTPATAKKLIMSAIALASAGDMVLVAGGTNTVDSTSGTDTQINLTEGVSLYGGYATDYITRDTVINETIITDSSTAITGNALSPNRALQALTGITTATIVDGFTINGGGGDYSAAIITNDGSPYIRGNKLHGGMAVSDLQEFTI